MKNKAFTLIEVMVVIAIIAMIAAMIMPAIGKIKDKINGVESPENVMANAEIVQINGTACAVNLDQAYKVELKPSFNGVGVSVYLSTLPDNSEIIQENGKTYLYWVPLTRNTVKTTLITAGAGGLKETKEITLMVR